MNKFKPNLVLTIIITLLIFSCNTKRIQKNKVAKQILVEEKNVFYDSLDKLATVIDLKNDALNKLYISKSDSSLNLTAQMKLDHRIFGYEKADKNSKRLFLLSIFTNDVKDNPYQCEFGSYYSTSDIKDFKLKFSTIENNFVKIKLTENASKKEKTLYFEKVWLEFE